MSISTGSVLSTEHGDFYQVTRLSDSYVWVRKIESQVMGYSSVRTCFDYDIEVRPLIGRWAGEEFRRKLYRYGVPYIRVDDGFAFLMTGDREIVERYLR